MRRLLAPRLPLKSTSSAVLRGGLPTGSTKPLTRAGSDSRKRMTAFARLHLRVLRRQTLRGFTVSFVSRGAAPDLRFERQPLAETTAQACAWAASAAREKGVTLVAEPSAADVEVLADSDALLSVLGNLLSNAVRYTPSGGRVTVRYGRTDELAWVEVADTGIGMTEEVRGRIFEKFYRGPEARSVEAQGLGLGLALVHQLVTAHGGQIEVESAPGQGSTFRVLLPLRPPGERGEEHGAAS